MKIAIIGGGNMGGAIARGLSTGNYFSAENISVIDPNVNNIKEIKNYNNAINASTDNYSIIIDADIIVLAVKPWLIEKVLLDNKDKLNKKQIIVSIAAGITLSQLEKWTPSHTTIFRLVPNTAIAVKQSMTFITASNASNEQEALMLNIFNELGKAVIITEDLIPAATSLASCGIAYVFRFIRAAMEGSVEMGFYPNQGKDIIIQTLRGAIELLETNNSHPEVEVDKVTTAGGITIKGLNELEHAGFTSAIIKALKASNIK